MSSTVRARGQEVPRKGRTSATRGEAGKTLRKANRCTPTAFCSPRGDAVIPVQQLDNKLSIIREVSGQTVKIKEMKTGGRNRPLNRNET